MDEIKTRLGRNVKHRRKQIGLSQLELAEKVDMSDTAIGMLERGDVWPEYDNLAAIAEALETTVEAFFDTTTPAQHNISAKEALDVLSKYVEMATTLKTRIAAQSSAPAAVTTEESELLTALNSLDSAERKHFAWMIREAAKRKPALSTPVKKVGKTGNG